MQRGNKIVQVGGIQKVIHGLEVGEELMEIGIISILMAIWLVKQKLMIII